MEVVAEQDPAFQVAVVEGGPAVEGVRKVARDPPQAAQERRAAGVQVTTPPLAALLGHGDEVGGEDRAGS